MWFDSLLGIQRAVSMQNYQQQAASMQAAGTQAASMQAAGTQANALADCTRRRKAAILRASRLVDGRNPETGLPC
jgi:hypothetical protein